MLTNLNMPQIFFPLYLHEGSRFDIKYPLTMKNNGMATPVNGPIGKSGTTNPASPLASPKCIMTTISIATTFIKSKD